MKKIFILLSLLITSLCSHAMIEGIHKNCKENIMFIGEDETGNTLDSILCNPGVEVVANTSDDIAKFMYHKDSNSLNALIGDFIIEKCEYDAFIYIMVAADVQKLQSAYSYLWRYFTANAWYSNVSDHSRHLAEYYFSKDSLFNQRQIHKKWFTVLRTAHSTSQIFRYCDKTNENALVRYHALYGSITDYELLKKQLFLANQHERLLFYSYIMADRYHYEKAKEDIIYIIHKFYEENDLGMIGEDTAYFCDCFR